jgi:membrane-associated phospholipid phosphatase
VDPILYWNAVAIEADRVTHTTGAADEKQSQGPVGSSRSLAIVHLAMHDAYFGIKGGYEPYLGSGLRRPPAGANVDSAVAAAAHATLSLLYPSQRSAFNAAAAGAGLVPGNADYDGNAFGLRVAAELLALRKNDPTTSDAGYVFSPAPPHHRPDPDNAEQAFYGANYGALSHAFAVTSRHHLDAPPQPGDPLYQRALRQVRGKGIAPQLAGTLPADLQPTRTPSETAIGLFWAYDGEIGLGTPPRFYNLILRKIAVARGNDVAANARLFALANTAMGDAGILCWADKYIYDLWRPVVGIRQNDLVTTTPQTGTDILKPESDPGWLPLGAPNTNNVGSKNRTPPFPSYPSGHATFGGAVFQTIRHFYGQGAPGPDNLTHGLDFVSDELNGVSVDNTGTLRPLLVRQFPGGLWQMMLENALSRVFLGVHWSFDAFASDAAGHIDLSKNVGGVRLGMDIANDIAAHGLKASAAAGPTKL